MSAQLILFKCIRYKQNYITLVKYVSSSKCATCLEGHSSYTNRPTGSGNNSTSGIGTIAPRWNRMRVGVVSSQWLRCHQL